MISLAKNFRTLAVAMGLAGATLATGAQAQTNTCGVTGVSATPATVVYDPFNPSGLATTSIVMNMTRVNSSGGGDTRIVNFFLRANSLTGTAADGMTIVPKSVDAKALIDGVGLNIFYNYNLPDPVLQPIDLLPTSANRFLKINFTGNNTGSDTAAVTFDVSFPANLDLEAVQSLSFDVEYYCNIQGGQSNGATDSGTISNAVTFPVTVLSALRASYVGSDLDFGEIGEVPAIPLTAKRTNVGNVRVQSSGAFRVQLTSANGYKLEKPGAANDNDRVAYKIKFLGDERDPDTVTEINHTCKRAGLATEGQLMPIQGTLIEGGAGKNPSPTYSDTLTVTITPLIYNTVTADICSSYSVP